MDAKLFPYSLFYSSSFAEITAFSDRHAEFEKLNTEILGVSIDSVVSHSLHLIEGFKAHGQLPSHFSTLKICLNSIKWAYSLFLAQNLIYMEFSAGSAPSIYVL